MKFICPKNITHVCLDGVYYSVRDGMVEIPDGLLSAEMLRLGFEPLIEAAPPDEESPPPEAKAKRGKK